MSKNTEIGYRDPFTYKSLPTIESIRLTNHVLNVEALAKSYRNEALHEYLHLLSQGEDPRKNLMIRQALEQIFDREQN